MVCDTTILRIRGIKNQEVVEQKRLKAGDTSCVLR